MDRNLKGFEYKNIIPWGRSYDEYVDMFLLNEFDLKKSILGVGDGPASFNAIHTKKGGNITSVDPTYGLNVEQFQKRISETYDEVMSQMNQNAQSFVWTRIENIDTLGKIRLSAMNEFCSDFEKGKDQRRYIEASLPNLPFENKKYDLVLIAHLLFFYSKNLDIDFHFAAIKELVRIGKEIRIFPIVDLDSKESAHLNPILAALESNFIDYNVETVKYHFQKTGNQMLKIKPGQRMLDFA